MPGKNTPAFARQPGGPPGTSPSWILSPFGWMSRCTSCDVTLFESSFPNDVRTGKKQRCLVCSTTISTISRLAKSLGKKYPYMGNIFMAQGIAAILLGEFTSKPFTRRLDYSDICAELDACIESNKTPPCKYTAVESQAAEIFTKPVVPTKPKISSSTLPGGVHVRRAVTLEYDHTFVSSSPLDTE